MRKIIFGMVCTISSVLLGGKKLSPLNEGYLRQIFINEKDITLRGLGGSGKPGSPLSLTMQSTISRLIVAQGQMKERDSKKTASSFKIKKIKKSALVKTSLLTQSLPSQKAQELADSLEQIKASIVRDATEESPVIQEFEALILELPDETWQALYDDSSSKGKSRSFDPVELNGQLRKERYDLLEVLHKNLLSVAALGVLYPLDIKTFDQKIVYGAKKLFLSYKKHRVQTMQEHVLFAKVVKLIRSMFFPKKKRSIRLKLHSKSYSY
ncbi:MAG: hypothetical protein WD068_01270 [Candidatus Babeliales bacterium]